MLLSLHIENLAVIKNIDLDFTDGFTVFTGETGAGKSIILDAINLLLGAKAERELVRSGESRSMVSGLFSCKEKSLEALAESGIGADDDGTLLVQRTVFSDGRSQIKINGRTVSLSVLKAITPALVSIHGQSDTYSLTDSARQLEIIDLYAKNGNLLSEYAALYESYSEISHKIRELSEKEAERERLVEILKYQLDDIDALSLTDGEEEELVDRKVKIKNSEKIIKNSGFAFKALKGSEKGSVSYLLDRSATALNQLSDVIPEFSQLADTLRDFSYRTSDIAEEIYALTEDISEGGDDALNEIESRLDKISRIKKKYGLTIKDVLEFRERIYSELCELSDSENVLKKLESEKKEAYGKCLAVALELSERRKTAAHEIENTVKSILEYLDMPKVVFFVSFKEKLTDNQAELFKNGIDTLEFYLSANRGAEPMPLSKVASGGEIARVMLALKSVIAGRDGISTVIFDEIDTGVSGKTARKIGVKMRELSKSTQIIAVTHSAQIASLASTHILIKKLDVKGKTETSLCVLDYDGRVTELSRILGGIDVTESQKMAAVDMLNEDK
jgi:DNA repair protein RecN (Recombination protein N)